MPEASGQPQDKHAFNRFLVLWLLTCCVPWYWFISAVLHSVFGTHDFPYSAIGLLTPLITFIYLLVLEKNRWWLLGIPVCILGMPLWLPLFTIHPFEHILRLAIF